MFRTPLIMGGAVLLCVVAAGCSPVILDGGPPIASFSGAAPSPTPEPVVEHVAVHNDRIELDDEIRFDLGTAKIDPSSYELINELFSTIAAHPEIEQVSIEGHTCNIGSAEANEKLSQRRADAVRKALVERGMAPERLVSVGYGESRPIADNDSETGREANRRVEFHVVSRGSDGGKATP